MHRSVALVALVVGATLTGCLSGDAGDEATRATSAPGPAGIFSATSFFPGAYETGGPFSKVLVPGALKPLPDEVVTLQSELDGVPILVGVVRPDVPDGTRVPVIAMLSYGLRDISKVPIREATDNRIKVAYLVDNFVPHGYAVAVVATRGTAGSGGCVDFLGDEERHDLSQAVTWLGTQPWSNGNVGAHGFSGDAAFQWSVASTGNPHLKTIVPVGGLLDGYGLFVRNGTMAPFFAAAPTITQVLFGTLPNGLNLFFAARDPGPKALEPNRPTERTLEGARCTSPYEDQRAIAEAVAAGRRTPAAYWDEHDVREEVLANYGGSVLLIHGFRDGTAAPHTMLPWASELAERGIATKLLLGQWMHTSADEPPSDRPNWSPRWDLAEVMLHWYDYWLKGDITRDLGPAVQVADQTGAWRDEEHWPPRDARPLMLHLATDGTLVPEAGTPEGSRILGPTPTWAVAFRDDAAKQSACEPACARFTLAPADRDLRFAGLPQLHVTVVPRASQGHLTAFLFVDGPDGLKRLSYAQMDLRYAAGGDEPSTFTPGQPLVARMEFQPVDAVIPAGSRLVLAVGQGASGTGETAGGTPTREAVFMTPVELLTGGEGSTLMLQAVERGSEEIVTPPWASAGP